MLCYKKIFIISTCCFVLTVIFGFAAYQSIFEYLIKNQISLRKSNNLRQFYLKYPIPLNLCTYFFNVTNSEEVLKGEVPTLKEVGPYCYDLYKERIDVEDNEEEDSLTYTPHDIYIFNQEKSGQLSQDDYVTILHPLIMGMVNLVATKSPQFLSIVDEALHHMFVNESIYVTDKVRNILFDGMLINCTSKDFSAMAACNQIKRKVPGIKLDGKDNLRYGILTDKNGTIPSRVTVLRGIKNSDDLGRLVAVDNVSRTDIWSNEECNVFRGTDGWIFPPFSGKLNRIWMHPVDFCMNLHADFVEEVTWNGMAVKKYYSDFQDQCANCSPKKPCPPRGLLNLLECTQVPAFISLPHFLRSDESLLKVRGLNPDIERHITKIIIESTLSLPMEAHIRVQFSFAVEALAKIRFMQNLPQVIHPVMWAELGVVLDGWFLKMVRLFFYFLTFIEVLKYIFLVLSLIGMGYGAYLYFNNKKIYSMKETIKLGCK